MRGAFIPYARPSLCEDDVQAVVEVLRGEWWTQGPAVAAFEEALAERVGARFAVAVSSGTAALHAAYLAAGLGPGRRLVTSPNTFAATASSALHLGARVDFADVEDDSGLIDPSELQKQLAEPAHVVAPVHFAGQPADLVGIWDLARRRGVRVVEDAAHALGASYWDAERSEWQRIGSCRHSDLCVFSFHAVKQVAMGEGGAVTTNDPELHRRLLLFRSHGITRDRALFESDDHGPWYYEMQALGLNYRVTDIQCALGRSQLGRLTELVARRREIAARYDEAFAGCSLLRPLVRHSRARSSQHLYVVLLDLDRLRCSRREIFEQLHERGIGANVHYIPVHTLLYYRREHGFRPGAFPRAESYYARCLSLPLFPGLADAEVERVIACVLDVLEEAAR